MISLYCSSIVCSLYAGYRKMIYIWWPQVEHNLKKIIEFCIDIVTCLVAIHKF
jgi:hypothetical protein